jgi:hypothetical protein
MQNSKANVVMTAVLATVLSGGSLSVARTEAQTLAQVEQKKAAVTAVKAGGTKKVATEQTKATLTAEEWVEAAKATQGMTAEEWVEATEAMIAAESGQYVEVEKKKVGVAKEEATEKTAVSLEKQAERAEHKAVAAQGETQATEETANVKEEQAKVQTAVKAEEPQEVKNELD